jgi:hypothetical protein
MDYQDFRDGFLDDIKKKHPIKWRWWSFCSIVEMKVEIWLYKIFKYDRYK